MKRFFYFRAYFLLIAAAAFFVSCSDSLPSLNAVNAVIVFDYEKENESPSMRLGVYAETESAVQRIKNIRVSHNSSGLEWNCSEPVKFSDGDKKNWAGYGNFVAQEGSLIPQGDYTIYYEDYAGEKTENHVYLGYPLSVPQSKSSDIPDSIKAENGKKIYEKLAVYDKEKKLIYFGDRKKTWKKDSGIINDLGTAETYRKCYFSNGGSVAYLLPESNLNGDR